MADRDDLELSLTGLAQVRTLHAYCMGLLHAKAELRAGLTSDFRCVPGLAHLIGKDWEHIENENEELRRRTIAEWSRRHPGLDTYAAHALEILSQQEISLPHQIDAVARALAQPRRRSR